MFISIGDLAGSDKFERKKDYFKLRTLLTVNQEAKADTFLYSMAIFNLLSLPDNIFAKNSTCAVFIQINLSVAFVHVKVEK